MSEPDRGGGVAAELVEGPAVEPPKSSDSYAGLEVSGAAGRARALVLDAFAASRRSGKPDWATMTTAVLKNRLLDLTDRTFAESDYGARDMTAFVRTMPDLLELIPAAQGRPAVTRLTDIDSVDRAVEMPASGTHAISSRTRNLIRPDLWNAALDWHTDRGFVLDDGRVRPRLGSDDDALPTFKPVSESVFETWKHAFVEQARVEVDGAQADALLAWASGPKPAKMLGRELQDRWMDTLRAKVLAHLLTWFQSSHLEPPADLVYQKAEAPRPTVAHTLDEPQGAMPSRRLKDFVLRCVHEMTEEELRALPIPAGVASRVRGG